MKTLIELKDGHFSYGKNVILNGINLKIDQGDFIILYGENGSGKSTLMKVLLKENILDGGEVLYSSEISPGGIGYVPQIMPQNMASFPISVGEVVSLSLYPELTGFKRLNREQTQRIDEVLEIVGMDKFKDELFSNLSGGQKQRVLIAKALVEDVRILFLDEPTNGIDIGMKNALGKLLRHLNEFHSIAIFIITHDGKFSQEAANKILYLENGRIAG